MCGICGIVDWSGSVTTSDVVARMTRTMTHRGPDDEGFFADRNVALGMRRLSIIDIEGGHQPVFNENQTICATLNGEIYNFKELADQLRDRGHTLKTRADSEVVAHAYEEWGPQCVERLEGMFAIAIYDRRAGDGKLFLARDRFGIKPLYYYQTPSRLVFASEVRTLLASGLVPGQLSKTALESYLLFGSVSEPMTLVDGVLSLKPGHRMLVDLQRRGSAQPECYWNVATSGEHGNSKLSSEAAAEHVRTLLEKSVRKHLIADVPVGVFLSSGIDSTALAALASREVSGVHTFTVGFAEADFSEAALARRTAEKFGTTHQEVTLTGDEMLARLPEAVKAIDQPTMDGINTYFVSWSARQAGLKVALSGLGGDEVFGGYSTFSRTQRYEQMVRASNAIPAALRTATSGVIAAASSSNLMRGDVATKLSALLNDSGALPHPFYFGRNLFTPIQVGALLPQPTNGHARPWWDWLSQSARDARQLDAFAAVSCLEMQSYLVNTLLRDTDFMSMAHSLEVRVPFLDHPLVEFVTQLPRAVKQDRGTPKALLVKALADVLPAEVVNQTKRGFTFPWEHWLRGPLKSKVESELADLAPALSVTLDRENVNRVWQDYLAGKTSWSRPWSLYVLNEWSRQHLR